jgi:hypothetical protein
MNIATGWMPLLKEGAVAVSGTTHGHFVSGSAAVVLVTASCISYGVLGLVVLVLDYLAATTVAMMLCLVHVHWILKLELLDILCSLNVSPSLWQSECSMLVT